MRTILSTAILSITGLAVLAPRAQAAALNPGINDLILAFEATSGDGVALNLEIDLGPASRFLDANGPFTLSAADLGNIGADLVATYGQNTPWYTRGDLNWGVFGSSGTSAYDGYLSATSFVTKAEDVAGVFSTPWTRPSNSNASAASVDIQTVIGGLKGQTSTANSNLAALIAANNSDSFTSRVSENGGTVSFQLFAPTIEGNFGAGTAGSVLDFYAVQRASGANVGTDATRLGTFQLDNVGNLTYSPVPEPASAAALVSGIGVLALVRRRRLTPSV